MSINFDALVLSATMATFAIGSVCYPTRSRPGLPPFGMRGVFNSAPITVTMQDGTVFDDQQTTFGVRDIEIAVMPGTNDRIRINEVGHPYHGREYYITDSDSDGQGGTVFQLRSQEVA